MSLVGLVLEVREAPSLPQTVDLHGVALLDKAGRKFPLAGVSVGPTSGDKPIFDQILNGTYLKGDPALGITTYVTPHDVQYPATGGKLRINIAFDKAEIELVKLPVSLCLLFAVPSGTMTLTLQGFSGESLSIPIVEPKAPPAAASPAASAPACRQGWDGGRVNS